MIDTVEYQRKKCKWAESQTGGEFKDPHVHTRP